MEQPVTQRALIHTINWVRVMTSEYGNETGMKCFDAMRESFGEELAGAVLSGFLTRQITPSSVILSATDYTKMNGNFINVIKVVRALSGCGLREAKEIVETIRDNGKSALEIGSRFDAFANSSDDNIAEIDRHYEAYREHVESLLSYGITVS